MHIHEQTQGSYYMDRRFCRRGNYSSDVTDLKCKLGYRALYSIFYLLDALLESVYDFVSNVLRKTVYEHAVLPML